MKNKSREISCDKHKGPATPGCPTARCEQINGPYVKASDVQEYYKPENRPRVDVKPRIYWWGGNAPSLSLLRSHYNHSYGGGEWNPTVLPSQQV